MMDNEDKIIVQKNKIHEVKYLIRDEFPLDILLEIKQVLEDSIDAKE